MRVVLSILITLALAATQVLGADKTWFTGDERCPPPKDDGKYSAPYDAKDHPGEFPTFNGADKAGWSCSYQREDGVIVQFGDGRSPQLQWMALWGGGANEN